MIFLNLNHIGFVESTTEDIIETTDSSQTPDNCMLQTP